MRRFLFIRLVVILACFVAGGLMAGVTVAGAKIKAAQGINDSGDYIAGQILPLPEEDPKKVTVSLVGDVLLASRVGSAISANGPDYPWQGTSGMLSHSDITIANLECTVSDRGVPASDKQYTFRANPDSVEGAVGAGVDIFTLANNHVMDYGVDAFTDMLGILKGKNINYVGAGENEDEAFRPVFMDCKGLKIAVLAYSRVIPHTSWIAGKNRPGVASGYNIKLVTDSIKAARKKADIIIVCMHWGKELDDFPQKDEINLGHRLIDAGADLVMGGHPHVLQGMEFYRGKLITYSMGNFIFTTGAQKAREGAILQVVFNGKEGYTARLVPTFIANGTTTILRGDERKRILSRVSSLSSAFGTEIIENGEIKPMEKAGGAK